MASRSQYWAAVVRSVFDQSSPANQQLTRGLVALLVVIIAISLPSFLTWVPGVDLEIPLRAASRWSAGSQPYLASIFAEAVLVWSGIGFAVPRARPTWV